MRCAQVTGICPPTTMYQVVAVLVALAMERPAHGAAAGEKTEVVTDHIAAMDMADDGGVGPGDLRVSLRNAYGDLLARDPNLAVRRFRLALGVFPGWCCRGKDPAPRSWASLRGCITYS